MSDEKAVSRRWLLVSIGVLLNGAVALLIATPVVGYLLGPIRKNGGYDSWIDLGDFSQFPLGQTRLASFVNPQEHAVGWRHQQGCLLGTPGAGAEVPGICHQLRPPGLPGALVSAVGALYVPMPWRRLLRRWLARRGTAPARPFRIRLQSAKRQIDDRWRPDAYLGNQRGGAERELRMHWLKRTYDWFEFRLKLEGPIKETVLHPVPRNTASWWYVFGSASFVLLMLQIATGILLAIVYVPSAGEAWNSLQVLNHQLPLGWFLRAMHGWGSNFMVAVVLIHMCAGLSVWRV